MNNNFSATIWIVCSALAVTMLYSCTPFTAPDRSSAHQNLPESFSLGETVTASEERWWLEFSSAQLNSLVDLALTENLTLHGYWARLEKAHALSDKAGSSLWPSVSGDASASYSKSGSNGFANGSTEIQGYSIGLVASYELDLWGRISAGKRSADLSVIATREDLNAAAMTVAAEVARRWIGVVASQQELKLLQEQRKINQTYLELIELRFRKSLATALDVMQQRQLVERVQAQIPLVEMKERLLQNELAVLTGQMPQEFNGTGDLSLPSLVSPPAGGIPAKLLENRPDIRAALKRLQSVDQKLVVAKADRLPAIRLTGSAGYNNADFDRIFDNWLLNLAAGLTAPLLDGGKRKAEVDVITAEVNEQLAIYHQTVLNAVKEVEESLIREEKTLEHIQRTERQLEAAQIALAEAQARYANGLSDYLPVLTQLLSVQNLEMDLVTRTEDLLSARISLYRAIGGTWTDTLSPPEFTTTTQQDERS